MNYDPKDFERTLTFTDWLVALRVIVRLPVDEYASRIGAAMPPNEFVREEWAKLARLAAAFKAMDGFMWENLMHLTVQAHDAEHAAKEVERANCPHDDDYWWRCAINEEGWECAMCGKNLGFRPDLDRRWLGVKVHSILLQMHENNLVYVSNSTMGEEMNYAVIERCRAEDIYDQYSIQRFLLEGPFAGHMDYWKRAANERLA